MGVKGGAYHPWAHPHAMMAGHHLSPYATGMKGDPHAYGHHQHVPKKGKNSESGGKGAKDHYNGYGGIGDYRSHYGGKGSDKKAASSTEENGTSTEGEAEAGSSSADAGSSVTGGTSSAETALQTGTGSKETTKG